MHGVENPGLLETCCVVRPETLQYNKFVIRFLARVHDDIFPTENVMSPSPLEVSMRRPKNVVVTAYERHLTFSGKHRKVVDHF